MENSRGGVGARLSSERGPDLHSVTGEFLANSHDVGGLRKGSLLEERMVRDKNVLAGQAADRRVEKLEELVGNARRNLGAVSPRNAVLMEDQDAAGLLHRGRDQVPVVRAERAQIENLRPDAFFFEGLGSLDRPHDERAVSNDGQVGALAHQLRLSERDHVTRPWIRTAVVRLAVKVLGFEEQRSEEHTSELQSRLHLVCRLLLEK